MIVRTRRSSSYTVINNKIINDKKLDWKELGLLVYLLSKPDEWAVSVTHLAKQRKTQTNGIYSILKTLRDIGYIRLEKSHTGKTDWVVYEKPNHEKPNEDNPDKEKPDEDYPNEDNPHQDNPILVSTERAVSTEEKVKEPCPEQKDSELKVVKKEIKIITFDDFYKKYPVKKSKETAKIKWAKMSAKEQQIAYDGIVNYLSTVSEPKFISHPSSYLNQKRWEDEPTLEFENYNQQPEREMI